ncbi:M13 family metallopeptidase [Nocardia uniformis]|uniref:M13 family metallopeptidase n=1 Tax=Nocardia uniformis TaxID=53432 RepID=A0A849BZ97_9NOCA|nr:M13 family metallopeptidase [Nocardia uniformis]NNH71832.1 M13 family metallopeptidase [Nocardia uniformis]
MSSPEHSFALDRRTLLKALGLVPAVVLLPSCTPEKPGQPAGPDLSGADPAIRPQDDLYRFVNGKWLENYRLPPDKTSYGTFAEVQERTEAQLREIVEAIRDPKGGSSEQQIRDLYDAYLDTAEIDAVGMAPLAPLLGRIDAAGAKSDLALVMGQLPIDGLLGLGVGVDDRNATANIASISQSGVGLPEQYFRQPQYADILAAYRTYLERIAAGAGFADPVAMAGRVFELEQAVAAGFWDNVRNRDPQATYNRMSWAELTALGPQFDWDPWLSGHTDRAKELFGTVVVRQPSFVTAAAGLWGEADIATWRDYLRLSLVRNWADYLKSDIADADFDFYDRELGGQRERPQRWKSGIGVLNANLGMPLGKTYVAQHFPAQSKQRVQDLVDDLFTAYRVNFGDSDWMSPPTRDAAVAKLDKINTKIGYPDRWEDYSPITITRGKLLESLFAVNTFEAGRMFAKLGEPVDKSEWGMPPQTVNAYYEPTRNEIVFPAAILQAPFFDADAAAAVNYGGIGAVIGHEIGHGFDDQGSLYDGDGNLHDWWTPEDRAAFEAKTKRLIDQYDALVPTGLPSSEHVNGALTVGENLADLRGLGIALAAYGIAEQRDGADRIDYTAMFESWGRIWRIQLTPQYAETLLAEDPHAPGEFRCNQTVRNLPEFYATFDVKDGDREWLAPDQRITL